MKIQEKLNTIPIFFKALRSKETPLLAKGLVLMSIAYVVLPADIITDFVPIVGVLDDAIVLPFLLYLASKMIPDLNSDNQKLEA